ncbi:hypothetical protein RGU75_11485 [Glaciimonas sp. CA11.2]|nr:hypothetical protein [Glaciimonas sp. CA11.2]MDY7546850.1 hypothetical protein [Glaciimonas sp. CA11.2]
MTMRFFERLIFISLLIFFSSAHAHAKATPAESAQTSAMKTQALLTAQKHDKKEKHDNSVFKTADIYWCTNVFLYRTCA